MKIRIVFLISLIIFLLQSTIMQVTRVHDIIPNLNLIILVFFMIRFDFKISIYYALFAGMLQDFYLSPYIGINIFIYIVIASIIVNFESTLNKVSIISPLFLIFISTIIYNGVFFLIALLNGNNFHVSDLINITIMEIILNVIGMIIFYGISRKIYIDR